MLEDDRDRIARFDAVLRLHHDDASLLVERTAPAFINAYLGLRFTCKPDLIALDHDLFVDSPNDPEPGDGRDVARFLADSDPICPVLIHSTNASAADSMLYTLLDAGWIADRISPLGDDWIEQYWYPYAKKMF
nr:cyclic-phosphate processing receiver domain-containing protein [Rhodopirellula sp. JC740]